jgi:hypothetical protein
MPWKPDWSNAAPPDDSLHRFDNSIARLLLDEQLVGYVAFQLLTMATHTGGHLWWRTFSEPYDVVMWMETFYPGLPNETYVDGVGVPTEQWLEDVKKGVWETNPSNLQLGPFARAADETEYFALEIEYLSGEERDRAWEQFGWGDETDSC